MFSDSIDDNTEMLRELLRGLPPSARGRAAKAAAAIEKAFTNLQKDHPKDGAVALGAAFAIFMVAAHLVEQAKDGKHDSLIELVN
jgi:hypothetical protein